MKFRKKPVVIEAVRWNGNNLQELILFGLSDAYELGLGRLQVSTLEGGHIASPGDWIIKGVKNEFYPCKPDIFTQTYEPAEGESEMDKSIDESVKATTLSFMENLNEHVPANLARKRTIVLECAYSINLPWDDIVFSQHIKKMIELKTERGKEVVVYKIFKLERI